MKKFILDAFQALDELEQALQAGDQRKIGGALYLLRYALQQLLNEVTR